MLRDDAEAVDKAARDGDGAHPGRDPSQRHDFGRIRGKSDIDWEGIEVPGVGREVDAVNGKVKSAGIGQLHKDLDRLADYPCQRLGGGAARKTFAEGSVDEGPSGSRSLPPILLTRAPLDNVSLGGVCG